MTERSKPSETAVQELTRSPLEVLAAELGAVAGQIERDLGLRLTAVIADLRRESAERELRFAKLERLIEERLAGLKDGERGETGPAGSAGPAGETGARGEIGHTGEVGPVGPMGPEGVAGSAGPAGETGARGEIGHTGEVGPVGPMGAEGVAGSAGPAGETGARGDAGPQGEVGPRGEAGEVGAAGDKGDRGDSGEIGIQGERGEAGPAGLLPVAKAWVDGVHYTSDVVAHAGSLFQAARDTAKEPPHADWICLAAAGANGVDGRSFTIRGTYAESEKYNSLDVVSLNGASFAAKRDNPGLCPGDGWQLIAKQGGSGKPGDRGAQGPKADRGPKVESLSVDDNGVLTLRNEDGSTVTCDLYPLLERIA